MYACNAYSEAREVSLLTEFTYKYPAVHIISTFFVIEGNPIKLHVSNKEVVMAEIA